MIFVSPNTLTFWHIIFWLLVIVVGYIFYKNIARVKQVYFSTEYYFFFWVTLGLLFITTIAFISPMFSFIFVTIVSGILSFTTLPFNFFRVTQSLVSYQQNFLEQLLYFMSKTQLLDFFSIIYIKYFFVDNNVFFRRTIILVTLSILSIFFSRWYFIQVNFVNYSFSILTLIQIYILLFFTIMLLYFRLTLTLARFLVFSSLRVNANLLSQQVLYILGEDPLPPKEDMSSTNSSMGKKSPFINIQFTNFYSRHRHIAAAVHNGTYNRATLAIGVGSFIVAGGLLYYAKEQINEQRIQNEHSRVQNEEFKRQNDLEEVSQGFRSKEDYFKTWGQSSSSIGSQSQPSSSIKDKR